MNCTNLRISYKADTGKFPLWGKDQRGKSIAGGSFIMGYPSSEYGRWLEAKTGQGSRQLQDEYYAKTREKPSVNYFEPRSLGDSLKDGYIEWLESKVLLLESSK
jgi:hypothetical protein